jgi:ribosomal protein L11 methyltransferase
MSDLMREWVEVRIASAVDAGELLGMLSDPAVAGAWQEHEAIHLYWPAAQWSIETLARLRRVLDALGDGDAAMTVTRVPNQDWNDLWARSVEPLRIGRRLVVHPSWHPVTLRPGDIELILDPKQAFGTGHHPTTALLLAWLEEVVRGGEQILDVGTGSGILAMAALRLGARSALGIDHDPVAIECARESAALNGFGPELDLEVATLEQIGPVPADLIVANLDRSTLLALAWRFEPWLRSGARILASGILREDRSDLTTAFALAGGLVRAARERDGWLAVEVVGAHSPEGET